MRKGRAAMTDTIESLRAEVARLNGELNRVTLAHTEQVNGLIAQRDKAIAGKLGMPESVYDTLRWALESMPLSKERNCEARTVAMIWIARMSKGATKR